jgi:ribosome-associated protein
MRRAIVVSANVSVPADGWSWRASRSSGPGGQNVNKVASRVELRLSLDRVVGLTGAARARLASLVRNRLDADGRLLVTSQATRDQGRNLEDAVDKARRLLAAALVAPRPRRPTRAGRAAVERRLAAKKRTGARKKQRGLVGEE